jgi:hypothetical protein
MLPSAKKTFRENNCTAGATTPSVFIKKNHLNRNQRVAIFIGHDLKIPGIYNNNIGA